MSELVLKKCVLITYLSILIVLVVHAYLYTFYSEVGPRGQLVLWTREWLP